jgi:hypothetical protein
VAVNHTDRPAVLSDANEPPYTYGDGLDGTEHVAAAHRSPEFDTDAPLARNVPPYTDISWPPSCVTPAPETFPSSGMDRVSFVPPQPAPAHGSADGTERSYDVR